MNLWNWQRLEAWLTLNARKSTRRRTPRAMPAHAELLESRALLSTLTVTTLDDTNVNGDGQLSLREAITIANSNSAGVTIDGVSSADVNDSIVFATGLNGTISLTGGQFSISAPVSISGGSNITIDAQQASRIFDLTATAGVVTLDGLTLVNGSVSTGSGGAIQAALGSTLTVSNSTLSGNSTTGAAVNGGAISSAGSLNIVGSTLTGNFTAGLDSDGGAIAATGTLAVVNSTLTGNFTTAADADGGAIYSTGATVSLVNATIDLNDAGGIGGGVNVSGIATINNTIIAQNTAGASTDLEIVEATTTFNNSLIGSNAGTTLTAAAVGSPDLNGNLIGTAAVNIDAGLGVLADNGGAVQTQALLSTSVARDAGDIAFALDLLGVTLTTDARGTGFLRTDGIADIGAFEVQAGINLAPVNILPAAQSVVTGTTLTLSADAGTRLAISDVDAGGKPVQVTLTATNGTVTLSQVTGLTFTTGDGTADAALTFTGTVADINAALDGAIFSPTAAFTGAASLQVVTSDQGNTGTGGTLTDTDTLAITVTAAGVNLTPVITAPSATLAATIGTALNFDASTGTISISDNDNSGTDLSVTLTATHGTLTLGSTAGLTFTTGDGSADATTTFMGSLADINAALATLSFTSSGSFQGPATVTVDVDDQFGDATATASQTVNLTVAAANVAPINNLPGTQTVTIGSTLNFTAGSGNLISISDADAGTNPLQVTLTATNGTFTLGTTAGLTFSAGDGTADATATFTGTLADLNTALASLSFTATAAGAATLQIDTNDQGNTGTGGALIDSDILSINALAVNVGPINTVPVATVNATTGVALVFSTANGNAISIADADAGVNPVQVTLTAVNGTLSLSGVAGLTFSSGDGTADAQMTFTGTVAAINAALAGASFTSTTGFTGAGAVIITTNDQGNTGGGGAQTDTDVVNVNVAAAAAANVAPINTVPVTVNATTGVAVVFSTANGNLIAIADADAGTNPVQVTLTATNGTLSLSGIAGLSFTAGDGTADATMTFTGTVSAINAALAGASFTSTAGFTGPAQITITTNDQGNTGTGGAQSDTDTIAVTVAAASTNLPPVNTLPGTQTVGAGGTITFRTAVTRDQSGPWSINGRGTSIVLNGSNATFTNEFGDVAQGRVISSTQVIADGWGGLIGDISADGNSISWRNGTLWSRPASPSVNTSISIADPDAGSSPVSVTLTAVGGTLTLSQTSGLTFTAGDGTADAAMTFTGTIANINAALQGSTYTADAGFSGEGSLTIVTNDLAAGGALSDTDTLKINVVGQNNSSLEGAWRINGQSASIAVLGNSGKVRFTNEFGDTANGRIISSTQVIADGWGGLVGTVSADGNTINWANNTTWVRAQVTPPSSFTPPTLAMNWFINGNQSTQITTNSPFSLTFRNEFGNTSAGTFTSPTQVVATGWGNLVGNLNANGTEIQWANNTRWTTSTPAVQPSSLDSAFADPLMTSMV